MAAAPACPALAIFSGLCVLMPSSPYRWSLLAPGAQGPGQHPSPACDRRRLEPRLGKLKDLDVSRCTQGRAESPQCTFLLEQKHLEGYGHLSTKMVERGMTVAVACPHHSSLDGHLSGSLESNSLHPFSPSFLGVSLPQASHPSRGSLLRSSP